MKFNAVVRFNLRKRGLVYLLFPFLALLAPGRAAAETPYGYSSLSFNKGLNAAAGPLFVGEGAVDVINALWDASGFMYCRNAFLRYAGTLQDGTYGITGLCRYIRRAEPPQITSNSYFLASKGQFVYSSTNAGTPNFAEAIGSTGGTISVVSGKDTVKGSGTYFTLRAGSINPFFLGNIDSVSYFRVGGRSKLGIQKVLNDTLMVLEAGSTFDTTATGDADYKIFPALGVTGDPSFFAQLSNELFFGDFTKPVWKFDGNVTVPAYIADSGMVRAIDAGAVLIDKSKAWEINQWRSFWFREANRYRDTTVSTIAEKRSPFVPIIGNDDTSLTLKYSNGTGDASSNRYLILSLPVEMRSSEFTVTSYASAQAELSTSGVNISQGDLMTWPLSVLITSGPGQGQLRVVEGTRSTGNVLCFWGDPFPTNEKPTSASKFVFIVNLPIRPKQIFVHQDRLWYAGEFGEGKNRIYYSEPLEAGNVGPFNFLDVFPRDGDELTNGSSYQGEVLAYKNNSIARIVGDNPSNFVVLSFLTNLGTPGPNTRTSFGGDEYFYDLRTGLYVLRAFNPVRLSDPVKTLLDSIPSASAKKAALTIYNDHLWFSYPAGAGQTINNRILTLNFRVADTWSRQTFTKAACFSVWPMAGDSSFFLMGHPTNSLIYRYDLQSHIDTGTSAQVRLFYKTGWMALSSPEQRKRLRGFQLGFFSDNTFDFDSVYFYKDFSGTFFDTSFITRQGQNDNYVTRDLGPEGNGRLFQIEMRLAPVGTFKLYNARQKWLNIGF